MRTVSTPLDALPPGALAEVFAAQAAEGERLIAAETVEIKGIRRIHSVDMQFMGQTHLLRVDLDRPDVTAEELRALFEAAYFRRFRVELADVRALVVTPTPRSSGRARRWTCRR
ncbi:MAG: hypothetical protein ACE368_15270 [Paracoccaceae bacterium]